MIIATGVLGVICIYQTFRIFMLKTNELDLEQALDMLEHGKLNGNDKKE